jgi:hypothetical protein
MERGPIMRVLAEIKGTNLGLQVVLQGRHEPMEIQDVKEAVELHSANGIRITTASNDIWVDASHVSAIWRTRAS